MIHDYYQSKYLQAYRDGLDESLARVETAAVRDAPAALGRFPVVIYGGGAGDVAEKLEKLRAAGVTGRCERTK